MKVEEVWSGYSASLKAFLHSRVSDPDEVDDLLQEIKDAAGYETADDGDLDVTAATEDSTVGDSPAQ